jgi:hypothetical protein
MLNEGEKKLVPYDKFFAKDWVLCSESAKHRYIFLRIMYAMRLTELGKRAEATSALDKTRDDLQLLSSGNSQVEYPRLNLLIKIAMLEISLPQNIV